MQKQAAIDVIEQKRDVILGVSDAVWDNPETKFKEFKSAKILMDALRLEGFAVQEGLADIPTAFSGTYGQGKPVIGILGEFDALDDLSQKADSMDREPVEQGKPGHGCGHNNLGAGALAAAIAVKAYLEETGQSGTVVYFGCPGEEGGSGKAFMARDGVFDDVDVALSWHPNEINAVWTFMTLANVQVKYKFTGQASHAGVSPHMGRSALDALELMNVGVQFLREHIVPEARIHYAITNTGGLSPNVVQPYAEVLYLIRAPENNVLLDIRERVDRIAKGAAMMTDTQVEIELEKGCSNIVPSNVLESMLFQNMQTVEMPTYTQAEREYAEAVRETIPQKTNVMAQLSRMSPKFAAFAQAHANDSLYEFLIPYVGINTPVPGSSDVGDVSWVCPTAQIVTVSTAAGTVNHSWQQVAQGKSSIAHKGTLYAGKVLAATAIDLLNDPEAVAKAKAEHRQRVGEGGYQPLITKDVKPAL